MSGAPEIERLIDLLAKLPGLGPRSARRAALTMVRRMLQDKVPEEFEAYLEAQKDQQ